MLESQKLASLLKQAKDLNFGLQGLLAVSSVVLAEKDPILVLNQLQETAKSKELAASLYSRVTSLAQSANDSSQFTFLVGDPLYEMNLFYALMGLTNSAQDQKMADEIFEDWVSENLDFPFVPTIDPIEPIDFGVKNNPAPSRNLNSRNTSNALLGGSAIVAALALSSQKILGG